MPPAVRIVFADQRFDGLPRALVGYGQDLPIVGVHAKLVAAAHPTQQAGVLLFPRLRLVDDDFQQEIMPGAPRPREEAAQLALVLFHDLGASFAPGRNRHFTTWFSGHA